MTTAVQRERIEFLLGEFNKLRDAGRMAHLARMQTFLSAVSSLSFRETGFNVLTLCGVGNDEVRHSAMLAWMLDAARGHGQGSVFLDAFLKASDIPLEIGDSRYHVRTEFCVSEAIVDILVYRRGQFIIYIENKVLAGEQESQIDREFRDMRRLGIGLHVPESCQFAVFLTPDGRRPVSGDASLWRTLSYPALASAIGGVMTDSIDAKLRGFIQDWVETIERWRLTNGYDVL